MSLLKYIGFLMRHQALPRNTANMLSRNTSKSSDTEGGGEDTSEKDKDVEIDTSIRDILTFALNTFYNSRKYGHELPTNNVSVNFEPLCGIPTGVFRETCGEILGAGCRVAGGCYQNPEFFSYHHMSYYDMHTAMRAYRKVSPQTGRKK